MLGIKVTLEQTMVNYRQLSTTAAFQRSFPLPPFSTVIGMVHNACDWESYHPMKVAVSGVTTPEVKDFSHINTFKFTDKNTEFKSALTRRSLLPQVNLTLTIIPADEADVELIEQRLKRPTKYLALGRHEDLVRIDSVKQVEVSEQVLDEDYESPLDVSYYIPLSTAKELAGADASDEEAVDLEGMMNPDQNGYLAGTEYRLTKVYHVEAKTKSNPDGTRVFNYINTLLVSNFTLFEGTTVMRDSDGDVLFPA